MDHYHKHGIAFCSARVAKYSSPRAMTSEEKIRALSLQVAHASENSEEFWTALDQLRAALKTNATSGRAKIAELRQYIPHAELNFPGHSDE